MTIQEFIFSEKRRLKIKRHVLFWVFIGTVYFIQSILIIPHFFVAALASLILFFPPCVLASYVCIYFLLPRFFRKKKYLFFGLQYLTLVLVCFAVNYLMSMLFYKTTNLHQISGFRFRWYFSLAFINTIHLVGITGLSLGIRFTKTWSTSQKENMLLMKEKIRKDVRLQKSRAYPEVIKKSLATLSNNLRNESNDSPELLMTVSDVFSYLLYSVNDKEIEIKTEISILKKIAYLENSIPNSSFLISLGITGIDDKDVMIHPLTLFSILQSGIAVLNEQKDYANELQLDIEITDKQTRVSIAFNSLSDTVDGKIDWKELFKNHIQQVSIVDPSTYKFEEASYGLIQIIIDTKRKNFVPEDHESKILIPGNELT